jgi:hypothetical protein
MMTTLAAVTAFTTLFIVAGTAGPAAAATGSGCPGSKTLGSIPTANNVSAAFSNSGDTTSYSFSSLTNENPVGGVPGLIKYCVYPTPKTPPTSHTVAATGDNGAAWAFATGSNNFAFVRPGGNKSNIGLDGTTTAMGTATWSPRPANQTQTIILHINDPAVCTSLYGSGTPGTCFVKPSTGPICDHGDNTVAYNAMPFDVVNCLNPAVAFEANGWNEFGDSVTLSGAARTLNSLNVDFQSFACQSGQWNAAVSNCASAAGAAFTHPITANIYAVADCSGNPCPGSLLATSGPVNQTIPYRPSADSTCPANAGGAPAGAAWFNPLAPGGGTCQNSIGKVLTFNFPAITLPNQVIWTVAFNTSTSGYAPMAPQPCQSDPAGCPYDSLNVGDKSYSGAPYAGASLFDTNGGLAVGSKGQPPSALGFFTPDDNGRPLGEIITTP